ncbi:MAG: ABC transporter permease [Woeseiaceae bacterium]|nr:ABC transporter permease [Woeseiaceae bacterium]
MPAVLVIIIMYRWRAGAATAIYASLRMLVQLLLIGYVLVYIFETDQWAVISAVLLVMLLAASWIAVRTVEQPSPRVYANSFVAVAVSGVPILWLVTQYVIDIEPWFKPRFVVPLGGMIFSGSMTAISIAAERLASELAAGKPLADAQRKAFSAAMIPVVNSLFAVGLVALPGTMTGQILSGVSPLIAAKYQIVVMAMLFGAAGIAAAVYLRLDERNAAADGRR